MSTSVKESACTACQRLIDSAAEVVAPGGEEGPPLPGDLTVCVYCGHIMAYADTLELRDLTCAEMIKAAGDPIIVALNGRRGQILKEWFGEQA